MSSIPELALRFGAESLNQYPIAYAKSRASGSMNMPYFMHLRAGCMPGQVSKFEVTALTKPGLGLDIKENSIIDAFKRERYLDAKIPIGIKFQDSFIHEYTYIQSDPYDDGILEVAIKASYRQIYGNFHAMESERPIESERRLRNGDISIREFIRDLAKSPFYKKHYLENVSQQRSVELSTKHILGRPPFDQVEISNYIERMNSKGFDFHIDRLINCTEYQELFGANIVPYMRAWNSGCGLRTTSFIFSSTLEESFASSDNSIHKRITKPESKSGNSKLLKKLINKEFTG